MQNSDLKSTGPFGHDLSKKPLKNLAKASDLQAEYEGSVPFTCSKFLRCLGSGCKVPLPLAFPGVVIDACETVFG